MNSRVTNTKRSVGIAGAIVIASAGWAQGPPAPKFEVASVRRSGVCASAGRGEPGGITSDAGRLDVQCRTPMSLIRMAYVQYPNGAREPQRRQEEVSGGPAWMNSERFDIEAKSETPQTAEMMRGPMLQRLLEERFQLKLHRESRETPMYALTAAKGGPKLQPAREGNCFAQSLPRADRPAGLSPCGVFVPSRAGEGTYMYGTTLANFCAQISLLLDREVVDKTGIAGAFDIRVDPPPPDASPDRAADAASRGPGPASRAALTDAMGSAILAAVQRAGLKLEADKGSREFIVIDRVERPSEN